MKRRQKQLTAALLALNVAAVAVPSATFTTYAAEVTAQDTSAPDQVLSDAKVQAFNGVKAYAGTQSYVFSNAAKTEYDRIIAQADKDINGCKTQTSIDTFADGAKKSIDNLANDDYKTAKETNINDAVNNGGYFTDTKANAQKIADRVIADRLKKEAVTKENADNCIKEYETEIKKAGLKSSADLLAEYSKKVDTYLPDNHKLEDYSVDNQGAIKTLRDTHKTIVAGASDEADLKAKYEDFKAAVDQVNTMSLDELKTARKNSLKGYWPEGQSAASYTDVQRGAIEQIKADGLEAITNATTAEKVNAEYDAAVKKINDVVTKDKSEAAVQEVMNQVKSIGKLDSTNYNDKYATIKSAWDNYSKLEAGSVGKDKIDKDNVLKDDPNYTVNGDYMPADGNGHYTYAAVLNNAKMKYDDIKAQELTASYKNLMTNYSTITVDNYQDYKAGFDKVEAAEKTLFSQPKVAVRDTAYATARNQAVNAYTNGKTAIIRAAKEDLDTLLVNLVHVIDGDVEVTEQNKADVEKAINAFRILAQLDSTDHDLVYANTAAYGYLTEKQKENSKLVAALKAYQDKQQAAEDKVNLAKATVTLTDSKTKYEYTGKEIRPNVTVKNTEGTTLVQGTDYTVTYNNNVNVGKVTITVVAMGNVYKGSNTAEFEIVQKSLADAKVTVENLYYRSGKARNASPAVKVDGVDIARNRDYTVAYKNNTNVGAATVEITGVGNYTGKTKATYAIMPEKAKITSLKAGSKKFTVKVVKEKGAKYQVAYKVKGTSKYKTVTTSNVTKTVKGLKKGKTYSVKVRAYQTINGKKYLGNYSNVKNVKVK